MSVDEAEKLLTDMISEADFCEEEAVPHITISDYEYSLSQEIIRTMTTGGTNGGHAILITAMLMAAVEDRVISSMRS